eukprot:14045093-Alexandrium_andersonii.AAC.1
MALLKLSRDFPISDGDSELWGVQGYALTARLEASLIVSAKGRKSFHASGDVGGRIPNNRPTRAHG